MIAMRTDSSIMHKAAAKRQARSQKGNALVEFALVLPVFLTLILLMVTFSIAEYNRTVLTYATAAAARAGGKYVAAGSTGDAAVAARAKAAFKAACGNSLISFTDPISVPIPTVTFIASVPRLVTVDATISYVNLNTVVLPLWQTMRIEVSTTMPIEQ
jgi:Flp pilus assembly protein TadG